MLSTFLDKIGGLFDRRFLIAYWFPTFIAGVASVFLGAWVNGWTRAWAWWQALGPTKDQKGTYPQLWILLVALLLTTLIAYLLQAFTHPLVQLYEGYWPFFLRQRWARRKRKRLERWRRMRAHAARGDWQTRYAVLQERLFYEYPPLDKVVPTRLGNVLRAAEEYGNTTYGMDTVFWWPRLWPLLPESVRSAVDGALTPLIALLNLATLMGIAALGGATYLVRMRIVWWQVILFCLGSAGLSVVAYHGAVAQAQSYGQHLRAVVDLYRLQIVQALCLPLPNTPREERALWRRLSRWLYNHDLATARDLAYCPLEETGETQEPPGT